MQTTHSFNPVCSDCTVNRHSEITQQWETWELNVFCIVSAAMPGSPPAERMHILRYGQIEESVIWYRNVYGIKWVDKL